MPTRPQQPSDQRRPGLIELIEDVPSGQAEFDHLLAYDVSRWGRFQDVDESAYYKFLCKRSGVQVDTVRSSSRTTAPSFRDAVREALAPEVAETQGWRVDILLDDLFADESIRAALSILYPAGDNGGCS